MEAPDMFIKIALAAMAAVLACGQTPQIQPTTDADGIRKAALDYIEGYYNGAPDRMERALHPDLAKRMVYRNPRTGQSMLQQMSALTLVQITNRVQKVPEEQQVKEVTILDTFGEIAAAKIVSRDFIDYVQLAKWNGQWKIVNVLWELKPAQKEAFEKRQ
jgi:hypothetical protein